MPIQKKFKIDSNSMKTVHWAGPRSAFGNYMNGVANDILNRLKIELGGGTWNWKNLYTALLFMTLSSHYIHEI